MNGVPRHPSDGALGAFVDGRLAPDEIAYVADHLRGCSDCRTVVSETARFEREEQPLAPPTPIRQWWKRSLAAAVATIAISVPLVMRYANADARLIPRMIAAAPEEHRLVEPRLSGFEYAPVKPLPRGGETQPDPAELKLGGVAGEVLEKTEERETSTAGHARGVALLLVRQTDESITALTQAARGSDDAEAWNDLAAARCTRAVTAPRPSEFAEALGSVERALKLDPNLKEALFNRALILEKMGFGDAARKAWERYLEVDPGSEWSNEARTRLKKLSGHAKAWEDRFFESMAPDALAREFPQETRAWGEAVLLVGWADAVTARDDRLAAEKLERARALADALRSHNGEQLFADAVAAIENADSAAREVLAEGHRTYDSGRKATRDRDPTRAEALHRSAELLFARAASPMANVARYYAAGAAFAQGRSGEARDELVQLLRTTDAARHRALEAQIHWEVAVIANAAADWGAATRHADASRAIFHELRETSNAAMADGVAAVALEMIGERELAWTRRLRMFAGNTNAGELGAVLQSCAWTLASRGRDDAAASLLALKLEAVHPADAVALSTGYAETVRLAWKSDDGRRAEHALASARTHAARVKDPEIRKTVDAQIDLAAGWKTSDARGSIAALDRAIARIARTRYDSELPLAYLQRARAHRAAGDDAASSLDLAAGLHEVERQRRTIPAGEWQHMFLDVATHLMEESIELRLAQNDAEGAFDIADRARALFDTAPLDAAPARTRPTLPPDVALIEYAVLPRSIVAFWVTNRSVNAHRIAIDRDALDARVDSFARRIRRRANADADAEGLYKLLLGPVDARLAGVEELVIVPDRQLHAVPFPALRNPATKKYLVEEKTLRFAPSAGFRAGGDGTDRTNGTYRTDETDRKPMSPMSPIGPIGPMAPALVVIDPPSPGWPSLSASREEGANIAALYRTTPLEGMAATRKAFVEAAQRSALIHFAGHANSDASTSYGALRLAASGSDDGIFGSSEIARLRLERQPLVILAACGTFRGDALHVSGMSSLSRAFLTAGARGVVGTLWEIDDDVSAPLFLKLHRYLHAGDTPAHALRRAQTDLLRSGDPRLAQPASWAAVEFLGGV